MANAFGSNPNASLEAALRTGADRIDSAVGVAGDALSAAKQGAGAMRGDAASMRQQASLVNSSANAVNQSADALAALVPQLDPYKDKLTNYGDDLAALAAKIQGRADDVFGQGRALVTLDPNAGGLAGEFMQHYDLLSPERYVSRYASDAQASIDNMRAQTERNLARRGVNVGSGADAGLMGALQRMKEAALLSAAKTLGYDKGVTERGNWLKEMTNATKTFYDMGTQQQQLAMGAKNAAADMAKGAARIITAQGGLIQNEGQLRAEGGRLFANAASIFGNAAGVEGNAANLTLSGYKTLMGGLQAAADYYLGAGRLEVGANNGGGGGSGRSVTVGSATTEGDDWMNWKGTGHSEGWNANNNPNYEKLISTAS